MRSLGDGDVGSLKSCSSGACCPEPGALWGSSGSPRNPIPAAVWKWSGDTAGGWGEPNHPVPGEPCPQSQARPRAAASCVRPLRQRGIAPGGRRGWTLPSSPG